MGGKKKGSLANRLARMSDEDRAKYLQRKTDMEEEARRRKEELISGFMKNKLKREEAFSRLNVAKINQSWHQTMRNNKVTAMKREVQHLQKWIQRTVVLKNATIKKLLSELDWQEDIYLKNFNTHSDHIDRIIEYHNQNLEELIDIYSGDRKIVRQIGAGEKELLQENYMQHKERLKVIIYGQTVEARKTMKDSYENHIKHTGEVLNNYKTELQQMQKVRQTIYSAIWRQIFNLVKSYIQKTDLKRSHLSELQRLDSEGALAIKTNGQLIEKDKLTVEQLKQHYENIVASRKSQIKVLKYKLKHANDDFMNAKRTLQSDSKLDENQLGVLTSFSNNVIEELERINSKGDQILQIKIICEKLEVGDEKFRCWETHAKSVEKFKEAEAYSFDDEQSSIPTLSARTKSEEIVKTIFHISTQRLQPTFSTTECKSSKPATATTSPTPFASFEKLEGLWLVLNKVALDCMNMRTEKAVILAENKKLKSDLRDAFEASALGKSIPSSKSSSTTSRRRFILSAPLSSYSYSRNYF